MHVYQKHTTRQQVQTSNGSMSRSTDAGRDLPSLAKHCKAGTHETCNLCVCGVSTLSVLVHGTVSAELLVCCQVSISISLHRGRQDQMAFSHANHKPSRMCMSGTCPLYLRQPSRPLVGPFTTSSFKQDHLLKLWLQYTLCGLLCLGLKFL